jgi:hypothetical protein
MKELFNAMTESEFNENFGRDEDCLAFLSRAKWGETFTCRKCGHHNYCHGKTLYSRRCTSCKHEESATSHTLFHHCRIPLHDAFHIAYLVCRQPDISTYELSRILGPRQMTCWKFKSKVMACLQTGSAVVSPVISVTRAFNK